MDVSVGAAVGVRLDSVVLLCWRIGGWLATDRK